jgi:hypothetical protein
MLKVIRKYLQCKSKIQMHFNTEHDQQNHDKKFINR